jgi:hypothetical protein
MRYWIRDRERRHGFPLYELVRRVRRIAGKPGSHWLVHRADGSGVDLQPLLRELSRQRPLSVSYVRLEELCGNPEHALRDLDAECVGPDLRVRFGLYQDAALFVEAPEFAARHILAAFKDIHPSPSRDHSSDTEPRSGIELISIVGCAGS